MPRPIPNREMMAPAGIMPSEGRLNLSKDTILAALKVPYSASIYMRPKMRGEIHL